MSRQVTLLRALLPVVCIALIHAAAAAEPAVDDLRKLPAQAGLTEAAKGVIGEYVGAWVERIKQAKTMQELQAGRGALEKGYAVQSSTYYQWEYAAQYAAKGPALLTLTSDPLRRVKEIYVGIVAEQMKQVTIQPLLEVMSRHGNPGVRYWAARAYWKTERGPTGVPVSAGSQLLRHGGRHARSMLTTLEKMGLGEASGPVLAEVLRALSPYLPVEEPQGRPLRGVLDKVWLARCKEVRAGRADVAEAYLKALPMVERVRTADEKLALQLFADAMTAASAALLEEKNYKDDAVWRAFTDLIEALEERLATVLRLGRRPMQAVLDDPKTERKVKAIEAGRQLWDFWRPKLNDRGVKARVSAAATSPATQPATRPVGG